MNLASSHPFWSVNHGLPANHPSLQRDAACDAVVVGGGITGALVAVHLAEAGVKTLLMDKRAASRQKSACGFTSRRRTFSLSLRGRGPG